MPNFWQSNLWQSTVGKLRKTSAKSAKPASVGMSARMYAAARGSRLAGVNPGVTSANSELGTSLPALRDRSRALIRDSAYAKRAKAIVVNNIIGSGVGMQAGVRGTRGELRKSVNEAIEEAWAEWSRPEHCHTGGAMHFSDLERQIIGQVFESGECFIRLHYRTFGSSDVPLCLELIEAERLAEDWSPPSSPSPGTKAQQGVEYDAYYRPVAYWIRTRHPGETKTLMGETDKIERVPAEDIIHLRLVDRWPQLRGEPWMHAVIRKLQDIDGYTEAEIVAARAASMYFGTIESNEDSSAFGEEQEDGSYQLPLEPGIVEKLKPGEKLNFINPNRPNAALDPFLRYMLREMAAGTGVSYESLSRDYSQSNYSSSRLALLDDRDTWRALQRWYIRTFRDRLHRVWLQQAVLSGAITGLRIEEFVDPKKFGAVSFKPRGWSWIDPTKEVEAFKQAVMAGFTTVADVVAETAGGRDLADVLEQRERELEEMDELDLVFDTSPEVYAKPDPKPAPQPAAPAPAEDSADPEDEQPATRVVKLRR